MSDALPAEDLTEDEFVIDRLGHLLAEIAIALKGPQPAGTLWSYHDLPELVRKVITDRDLYKFQAETNAQTVIGQANEIRRLGRLLDVEQRAVAAAHDVEERF
jgi:hypothetical protein